MIEEVSQYHWPVERVVEHREDLQQDVRIPVGEAIPFAPIQSLPKLFIGTFNRLCGKLLHKGGVKVIFCVCQIVTKKIFVVYILVIFFPCAVEEGEQDVATEN